MKREALDVAHHQAMRAEEPVERGEREVGEMLVIDRVEFAPIDEVADVRHLDHDQSARLQDATDAAHDAAELGDVGEHVVGMQHVCEPAVGGQALGQRGAKEVAERRDTARLGDAGDIRGRLDAEDRHAEIAVVLEQVAVVARDLDDQRARSELAFGHEALDQLLRRADHRVRKRREVWIVAEQALGRHRLRDLDQRARGAEHEVQRVGRLRLGELLRGEQRVGQRRAAERENGRQRPAVAAGAAGDAHGDGFRCSRYQLEVRRSPSSSPYSGRHPSSLRALPASRY